MSFRSLPSLLALSLVLLLGSAADGYAQKHGGVLRTFIANNPTDLSLHENTWPTTSFPMAPVYSNLVVFDTFQVQERPETIQPELAESWSWEDGNRALTFRLRKGVKWHDGRPLTAADVKHTFDIVRGVSPMRLKLNPRKLWYFNVEEITTKGDNQVTFRLKRPQPSLLSMLASGWSAVYPADRPPAQWRTSAMGTGPFKLKRYVRDQRIELEKNRDYFVPQRPYLDGIHFYVLKGQATQNAALMARQVDSTYPSQTTRPMYEQLKAANVSLAFIETVANGTLNIIVNTRKPPFNEPRLREVVNLALDRNSVIRTIYQNGAVPGTAVIPAPWGLWGLTKEQIQKLPGYGDPAANKAEARRLLAAEGYTEQNPLHVEVTARAQDAYVQPAVWVMSELKAVGIQTKLVQVDPGVWSGMQARRDFQLAVNATAVAIDDPDAALYENYACGSQRNLSDYCNPELEKKFDLQSVEFDFAKRHKLVQEIDTQLQREVARPYLAYRIYYYAHYPFVKNWIPHASSYNAWRMQEVWLDK